MKKYIKFILMFSLTMGLVTTNNITQVYAQSSQGQVVKTVQEGIFVQPLTLIKSPGTYINKAIIMDAKFDKFSTLGLDYKSAFRSSEDYISFLIKRDDTNYNIPLSELKLFLKRDLAEKFIELKTNDKIQIKGVVFSDALGDTWVDVKEIKITEKAPDEKK